MQSWTAQLSDTQGTKLNQASVPDLNPAPFTLKNLDGGGGRVRSTGQKDKKKKLVKSNEGWAKEVLLQRIYCHNSVMNTKSGTIYYPIK